MKILLTGATGLLGTSILGVATSRVFVCDALARSEIAASSPADLAKRMEDYELIIHAAANTNVEQCEIEPEICYRDNFLLTESLAFAAMLAGVRMTFVSSTGVYGAHRSDPYREYDAVAPTTHHHRSKLMGEQSVLSANPRNLVVRTGWLFGGPAENPKNFVSRRIDEAHSAFTRTGYIQSNIEQRGVPSFNKDIATRILDLAESGSAGIYNCTNGGNASRFEYVKAIIELTGLAIEVRPSSAATFNRKAKVSNNEMTENWKMTARGWPAMPDWRDSLASYISDELIEYRRNG